MVSAQETQWACVDSEGSGGTEPDNGARLCVGASGRRFYWVQQRSLDIRPCRSGRKRHGPDDGIPRMDVDRSFWRSDHIPTHVSAYIFRLLKASLKLVFVADGVEREEQRECMRKLCCEVVQVYLVSRPMPADEVTQWLS